MLESSAQVMEKVHQARLEIGDYIEIETTGERDECEVERVLKGLSTPAKAYEADFVDGLVIVTCKEPSAIRIDEECD